MTKILPTIDGKSISETTTYIMDKWRYRKYADTNYVSIIWINKENTIIKLLDGKIDGVTLIIPALNDMSILLNKVYITPSKKIVTRLCIVKEDINSTIDIEIHDVTSINKELLKAYTKIKLLEGLSNFNLGQVILGASIGLMLGFVSCMIMFTFIM